MDTRVSLEVFFVKTNEICHTYKSQIHVGTYGYRLVSETLKILRFMVLSFEIETNDFNLVGQLDPRFGRQVYPIR